MDDLHKPALDEIGDFTVQSDFIEITTNLIPAGEIWYIKAILDGIGYQDSINGERAWWADYFNSNSNVNQTSVGKTVAWINYVTNVNRTFGNFATGMSEEFMVLNRQYSPKTNSKGYLDIEDLTTYIDPVKYNYIFADTNLDAMNF